ncbi:MAG TPA: metalloregulator ArsR/SmtB family transcription factor [Phycisphaerales bacterium]|nr:metalloregulator ArsR/SmtB family transcription factor [Phycisphaerales bacterium]
MTDAQMDAVAGLFGVLSEGSRLRLLQALHDGPANVSELVRSTGMKQANVSKQLGVLQGAGVVARERIGNEVNYWIEMPIIRKLCDLVCTGIAQQASARADVFKRRP